MIIKMGQYYKFINLDKKEKCDRNQFPMKLTEHSYVGNDYCNDILTLLSNEWKGDRVIHVGDYAQSEDGTTTAKVVKELNKEFDVDESLYLRGCYFLDVEPNKVNKKIRYVYNLDKKSYVDLYHQPIICTWYYKGKASFGKFNSFALLTGCGNGLGGGDYWGCNDEKIGYWANDHFVSSDKKLEQYKDFKEEPFVFYEKYKKYDYETYNEYGSDQINNGIDELENLIERLKKYDEMPKCIKFDVSELTEEEINCLEKRNIKDIKIIKNKDKQEELCK